MDEALVAWCRRWLGAEPVAVLFRAGVPVAGDRAAPGRRARGGGQGATAEELVAGGDLLAPGPDAAGRFASLLAELVRLAPDPAAVPTLAPSPAWAAWDHDHPGLWPPPDDRVGDLDDHPGPAWLDRVAAAVRERLAGRRLPPVVGHADWESQNLRWRDGRPLAVHDWDSAVAQPEAVVAGLAAAVWPAAPARPPPLSRPRRSWPPTSGPGGGHGRPPNGRPAGPRASGCGPSTPRRSAWAAAAPSSTAWPPRWPSGRAGLARSLAVELRPGGAVVGVIESVNVGTPRGISWRGQTVRTAIWKDPVPGRVGVRANHVEGDEQGNPQVHGGYDKALYAYAAEDYEWWGGELGRELSPGTFGENLTLRGIDVSGALVGERWRAGEVLLEVSSPRIPCFKLGYRMGDQRFVRRFAGAGRPGAYLRILTEGELAAGDPVEVVHRPGHGLTIAEFSRIYHRDRAAADRLLGVPELSSGWREWAEQFAAP